MEQGFQGAAHAGRPLLLEGGLDLCPDLDAVEALSPERDALWARLEMTTFLTSDEKRTAIGYAPLGDDPPPATKFNPHHDDRGRFTFGPDGGDDEPIERVSGKTKGGFAKEMLKLTVRQFVSSYCKGTINRELPGQFEDLSIKDIIDLARGGDRAAKTCAKFLKEPRFRK